MEAILYIEDDSAKATEEVSEEGAVCTPNFIHKETSKNVFKITIECCTGFYTDEFG
jgi:hypothetical protein